MSYEWNLTSVGQFCPFAYGKNLPERTRTPGRFPVISSAGFVGTHNEALVKCPGVVIGRKGTVGSVTYAAEPFWPIDTTFFIVDEPAKRDIRFVFYLLQSLGLDQMNSDSAVPGLNRENAHAQLVRVPALDEQRRIGATLGLLDQRIEVLHQTNGTLEAIAQSLFKSWFVDFDPVRAKAEGREPEGMDAATAALFPCEFEDSELGPIPKGWSVRPLDTIASYLNGLALQKYPPESEAEFLPVIKIAQLRAGHTNGSDRASAHLKPDYVVEDGDVLFSWSGSLEVEVWCGGRGALNQHLFKVTSSEVPKWFYYFATRHHLPSFRETAAHKATTMGHIQRRHLTEAKITLPPDDVMRGLSGVIRPLFEGRLTNALKAKFLAELRDTLLPRLISGKLRLPEVEATIEEEA